MHVDYPVAPLAADQIPVQLWTAQLACLPLQEHLHLRAPAVLCPSSFDLHTRRVQICPLLSSCCCGVFSQASPDQDVSVAFPPSGLKAAGADVPSVQLSALSTWLTLYVDDLPLGQTSHHWWVRLRMMPSP